MVELIAYTITLILHIPLFIMVNKRDKKYTAISLILLTLMVSSCQKDEIIIQDNSRLYIEYSCDAPRFDYTFIINNDTIAYKENVLDYKINIRETVNKGDVIVLYFHTDKRSVKELSAYLNSKLWQHEELELQSFQSIYTVE